MYFYFLTFPVGLKIHIIYFKLNSNCSNALDRRNLQEKVKKAFCSKKLYWLIVLVISKFLQILGLPPRISKVFLDH